MFPRSRRISRADFSRPGFLAGRRKSSAHFSVVFPSEGSGAAVVISKKTVRLSVDRHRLKRRVLSALRHLDLPRTLVVYPKASVQKLPFDELCAELQHLIGTGERVR